MMKLVDFEQTIFNGEMLPFERFKLYNWICEISPKIIFEVGTGEGGGSTYYISLAIKNKNYNTKLYTCDPIRSPNQKFLDEFNFISYSKDYSHNMIKTLIDSEIKPDFIMFDGPENPEVAYDDIIYLENYIKDGTYFCMHDWDHYRPYDNGYSTKSVKIREYIENSNKWELIERLDSDKKNSNFDNREYDSVGLCLYKYKK
jgi:hypothetical protein